MAGKRKAPKTAAADEVTNPALKRNQDIAALVRERMEERDVSAYLLGELTGVARSTIGNLIGNKRAITSDKLAALMNHLHLVIVPVEQVMPADQVKSKAKTRKE